MPETIEVASHRKPVQEKIYFRFGATLLANFLRAGFSFASSILIARGLEAPSYGNLNFLMGSFAAVSQLIEMGSSSAFYTFISQKRRGPRLLFLYSGWLFFQLITTMGIVGLMMPASMIEKIWVSQARGNVLLAFVTSFAMTRMWGMVSHIGEAARKTVIVQIGTVAQSLFHLIVIVLATSRRWLTVPLVMWLLMAEYLLLVACLAPIVLRGNLATWREEGNRWKTTVKEFFTYCQPLILYSIVSFIYTFADRWLLQNFGGSDQQGFYAVAQQFANISLFANISILKIFWKEIAEAHDRRDLERLNKLYFTVTRGLYLVACLISSLLIPYSREILRWTVGIGYESGWICLAIMFLYPIHQTLGQLQGTYFYASGDTKNYTRIGLVMMGVSIPVTYFMLAPPLAKLGGLGLGALGLAVKMVLLQIIGVNIQAYVIARKNRWKFNYHHQGIVMAMFLPLGWVCKWIGSTLLGFSGLGNNSFVSMSIGSFFYFLLLLIIVYRFPEFVGLTRDEIAQIIRDSLAFIKTTLSGMNKFIGSAETNERLKTGRGSMRPHAE